MIIQCLNLFFVHSLFHVFFSGFFFFIHALFIFFVFKMFIWKIWVFISDSLWRNKLAWSISNFAELFNWIALIITWIDFTLKGYIGKEKTTHLYKTFFFHIQKISMSSTPSSLVDFPSALNYDSTSRQCSLYFLILWTMVNWFPTTWARVIETTR